MNHDLQQDDQHLLDQFLDHSVSNESVAVQQSIVLLFYAVQTADLQHVIVMIRILLSDYFKHA